MSIIHGRSFLLQEQGTEAFAASNSCSVTLDCETIEIAGATSGQYREYVAGRKGWTASTSVLVTAVANKFALVGATYTLIIGVDNDEMQGDAICTAFKVEAQVGNLLRGVFEFQGTGPLEGVIVES